MTPNVAFWFIALSVLVPYAACRFGTVLGEVARLGDEIDAEVAKMRRLVMWPIEPVSICPHCGERTAGKSTCSSADCPVLPTSEAKAA